MYKTKVKHWSTGRFLHLMQILVHWIYLWKLQKLKPKQLNGTQPSLVWLFIPSAAWSQDTALAPGARWIAHRCHWWINPRDGSRAQIRAEVRWNMALSRGLRCCQRVFSWIPVLIITSVVLWSYYAYVFELCLCKYEKLGSFRCDFGPFKCGHRRLPHSSVDKNNVIDRAAASKLGGSGSVCVF